MIFINLAAEKRSGNKNPEQKSTKKYKIANKETQKRIRAWLSRMIGGDWTDMITAHGDDQGAPCERRT